MTPDPHELINDTTISAMADWAAVFIATCAFFLTVWQAALTRNHNRLMVKPKLQDNISMRQHKEQFLYEYTLTNGGLGPAIIDSFEVYKDGKLLFKDDHEQFKSLVYSNFEGAFHKVAGTRTQSSLLPGETSEIIKLSYHLEKNSTKDIEKEIRAELDKYILKIKYSSVYGESFEFNSNE